MEHTFNLGLVYPGGGTEADFYRFERGRMVWPRPK
jgi:hypothetical protein